MHEPLAAMQTNCHTMSAHDIAPSPQLTAVQQRQQHRSSSFHRLLLLLACLFFLTTSSITRISALNLNLDLSEGADNFDNEYDSDGVILLTKDAVTASTTTTTNQKDNSGTDVSSSSTTTTTTTSFVCASSSDCSSHGVCRNGDCMCFQSYTGQRCQQRTCPQQCNGQGECDVETGKCVCYTKEKLAAIYPIDGPLHEYGFTGETCAEKMCFTDCGVNEKRGSCNTTSGLCQCASGYYGAEGLHCNSILCSDPCSQHGICMDGKCLCDVAQNKMSGWRGDHCELEICPNHCLESEGLGKCVSGVCQCIEGFTGDDCSIKACPVNYSPLGWIGSTQTACSGHGACVDGECQCTDGFIGEDCSKRVCPGKVHVKKSKNANSTTTVDTSSDDNNTTTSCSGHGTCQSNGICLCHAGWTSDDCYDRSCPTDCGSGFSKPHGICDGETGRCECKKGWYGPSCEYKDCTESCHTHGECHEGSCVCNPGYQGEFCEHSVCSNNCFSEEGHGRCVDDTCICAPGFHGVACEYEDCPVARSPSMNGTVASNTTELLTCAGNGVCLYGKCVCTAAWTGSDCTTRKCPFDCSGVGECAPDGTCLCPQGDDDDGRGRYEGKYCETAICPSNCGEELEHGECIHKKCYCESGYGQPDCLYPVCPSGLPPLASPFSPKVECSGAGKCVRGVCQCNTGWTGDSCSDRPCLNDCFSTSIPSHGKCQSNGLCRCTDQYNGPDCAVKGCPLGCSLHGSCLGDGKCRCTNGWTGDRCEIKQCLNKCSENGECIRLQANAETGEPPREMCKCEASWTGIDCSQPVCMKMNKTAAATVVSYTATPLPLPPIIESCGGPSHGRCVQSEAGVHVCRCTSPYVGAECGSPCSNTTCSYHGVCLLSLQDGITPQCECDPGWYGPSCDRTSECEPQDCYGRGTCISSGPQHKSVCSCQAPFGGPDCSLCTHNCTGHGTCTPNGCKCQDGWLGELCDRREDCDPADCGGKSHGTCGADADGEPVCRCKPPWSDFDCMECTLRCNDNGVCNKDGKCTCDPGWHGEHCDRYGDCPNNCSEKGVCVGDEIGDPICKCAPGYGGRDCGSLLCTKSCGPNSQCLDDECVCAPGYRGDFCTERVDCPEDCNSIGTCMSDWLGFPFCKCPIGYGGDSCQYTLCNQMCSSHGTCHLNPKTGIEKCTCDAGWSGKQCEKLDCEVWNNCGGELHGECGINDATQQPICLCNHPYTGTNCTDVLCSDADCIHGTCVNSRCQCDKEGGWRGPRCDYRVPCPAPGCGNEGHCVGDALGNGVCECNPGFTGVNCQDTICDDTCSDHGRCLNDECVCEPGYHGSSCEITAPCPANCNGHGICSFDLETKKGVCDCDEMWDASTPDSNDCAVPRGKTWLNENGGLEYTCYPPYYGPFCQQRGCSLPCQHNGTCQDDGTCECPLGYGGVDCSQTVCQDGCNGGGECDLLSAQCRCFYGYSGAACQYYNEDVCLSTCSFKCSLHGRGGLISVFDRAGDTLYVNARDCHTMCKLPTMCQIMFGSGHKPDATTAFVRLEKPAPKDPLAITTNTIATVSGTTTTTSTPTTPAIPTPTRTVPITAPTSTPTAPATATPTPTPTVTKKKRSSTTTKGTSTTTRKKRSSSSSTTSSTSGETEDDTADSDNRELTEADAPAATTS